MEYIKKEELIIGEVYTHQNGNICRCDQITNMYIIGKHLGNNRNAFRQPPKNPGNFLINHMRLATPEEKHWLNCCITANKFITFEEAMKTFIPEYVEAIQQSDGYTIGKIYKTLSDSTKEWYRNIDDKNRENGWSYLNFKPSTKEAYDAQFVVKEPEFVLPEKWCISISEDVDKSVRNWFNKMNSTSLYTTSNNHFKYLSWIGIANSDHWTLYIRQDHIQITFEQFKKYVLKEETIEEVIEPLPQFKVIETIETITKVENNEGNQFFIGDVVKSSNGTVQTIESFDYNTKKTNIIAFTNKQSILGNGIGIDKIEHYIEPKTDYKILEYKTEGGISCKAPFLADSHQFYINERCKIYSIKRISDDLIITVGDEVLSKTCGVPNKILSIELINNKIRLYPRNSFYNLEDIIKV